MKTNTDNEREFFEAIDKGNVDSVRKLVAQQPELLNSYNYSCFGATPLTSVAFKDDREMIDVLLELGADPNRCSIGIWARGARCTVLSIATKWNWSSTCWNKARKWTFIRPQH